MFTTSPAVLIASRRQNGISFVDGPSVTFHPYASTTYMMTEGLSMKSDQAACTGVFHPLADFIFCARVTSQNESIFPRTAAEPRARGTHAPSLPARGR